ncbi:MAG: hypothetical protein ACLPYS_15680 [Vulcanimicrobiaceae bacterium]
MQKALREPADLVDRIDQVMIRSNATGNQQGPVRPFGEDVWIVDGPPARFVLLLPTRMIVARLSNGSLWVNSPVDTEDALLEQILAVGPVRYLVAPKVLHIWRLERARCVFPDAEL